MRSGFFYQPDNYLLRIKSALEFTAKQKQHVPPYTFLASYYDSMMRHISYREWADYYDSIFRRFGFSVFDICELACGTGSLAIELYQKGYNLTCSDRSHEMIEIARKKCKRAALNIPFKARNMLDYHSAHAFDAVICAYDSVNYLLTTGEIISCLNMVSRLLKPNGVFIFDVSTEYNSRTNFSRTYEWDPQQRFKRYGFFDAERKIQHHIIEVESDGVIYCEEHQQRIYPLDDLKNLIDASVWEVSGLFGDFTYEPVHECSERAHFILQKK